ncbi:hypothetical protein [Cupriavidus sp. 8B]
MQIEQKGARVAPFCIAAQNPISSTRYEDQPALKGIRLVGLWAALRQAHAYAARNWKRLAQQSRRESA